MSTWWHRFVAVTVSFTLISSSASAAVNASVISLVGLFQARRPHYTETPRAIDLGGDPKREDLYRGGMYNDEKLLALDRAMSEWNGVPPRGAQASTAPDALMDIPSGDAGSGSNNPWEGYVAIQHGKLNTQTGNKLTTIPLTGWKSRGNMGVGFAMHHNGRTTYNAPWVSMGWSHSYDIQLFGTYGEMIVVRWGDGTSHVYSFDDGSGLYSSPTGVFDKLTYLGGTSWKITKPDQTVFTFSAGKVNTIYDRNANTVVVGYTNGKVSSVTDTTGRVLTINYNASGKISSVVNPAGESFDFWYGPSGGLGGIEGFEFTYTLEGRIATLKDRRGKTWGYTYYSSYYGGPLDGFLASETSPLGHTTNFVYPTTACNITLPLGQVVVHNYSGGRLVSAVDPALFSESFGYGSNNTLTSYTDKRGKIWQATYDNSGNCLSATNPYGHTDQFTYSSANDLLTARDSLNNVTTVVYNAAGNPLTVTDPLGRIVATNTFDYQGQCLTTKNALNQTWTLGYSAQGDLTSVQSPNNNTSTLVYDSMSRVISGSDPLGNTTQISYDIWSRPSVLTHPGGATVSAVYDGEGNVTRTTNELGRNTDYLFDDAGRLTSVTNAKGEIESYLYNNNSWLTTVVNARGYSRAYQYTARGEVANLTLPDGAFEQWSYNANGDVSAYTNPIPQTISYVYDDAGRNTLVDYPTGTDTSFSFDNAGRLLSMADSSGTTSWIYNAADEITRLTSPQGVIDYTYYASGRRATMVEAGVGTTTYNYRADGLIGNLTNPQGEQTAWQYDLVGRCWKQTFSSGGNETYGYDNRSRLVGAHVRKADNTLLRTRNYYYDAASNLTSEIVSGVTTTYGYDLIDQLVSESRTGYSCSYSYDANGNRATRVLNGLTETYSYDQGDKLQSVTWTGGSKTYLYDQAGRTTRVTSAAGQTNLSYDFEGRITGITYPGGATNSNSYNGLDTRVSKTDSGGTKTFKRDGAYVTDPVLSDGAANYTPGISERRTGTTIYLHSGLKNADAQGTTGQTISGTRQYDAFGNLQSSTGTWIGPFGYAGGFGYQEDVDSGLKLLGHRYYDSSTGRFLSRDPVWDGRNWYSYCESEPVASVDPEGTWFWKVWDIVDVVINPSDPLNWIGLVDPTPISRGVKLAKRARKVAKAIDGLVKSPKPRPKPGSAGGLGAGKNFSKKVKNEAREQGRGICPYCGRPTGRGHIDHAIAKSKGGNNSIQNAQCTCAFCNLSKGAGSKPKNPRPPLR